MFEYIDKDNKKNLIKDDKTGIPTEIKLQYEKISSLSFDDVRVNYNSDKPAQFQSFAYTQGNNVYVAPCQEKYLKHELGHVIQQKRGNVKATGNLGNILLNDSPQLEREADQMASGNEVVQRAYVNNIAQIPAAQGAQQVPRGEPVPILATAVGHIIGRDDRPDGIYKSTDELSLTHWDRKKRRVDFTAYHHVIPVLKLTSFWNKMISLNHTAELRGLMNVAVGSVEAKTKKAPAHNAYSYASNTSTAFRKTTILGGATTFANARNEIANIGQVAIDANAMNEIVNLYQWLPGNLVLGPGAHRANEPSAALDNEAGFAREKVFGEDRNLYKKLNDNLNTFLNAAAPLPQTINDIIDSLKIIASREICSPPNDTNKAWHRRSSDGNWAYQGYKP